MQAEAKDRERASYQYSLGQALLNLAEKESRSEQKLSLCGRASEAFTFSSTLEALKPYAWFNLAWLDDEIGRVTNEHQRFEHAIELLERVIKIGREEGYSNLVVHATFNKACVFCKLERNVQAVGALQEIRDYPGVREMIRDDADVKNLSDAVYG